MKRKKERNALVPVQGKAGVLYVRMRNAIAQCYSVDDCKKAAMHASAISAYYAQIKDDESYRKFIQIKLRAWRRIGEIITRGIDKSGCYSSVGANNTLPPDAFNTAAYIRKIRATFEHDKAIQALTDNEFRQAIKIAEVPAAFFEKHVLRSDSISAVVSAFAQFQRAEELKTPEGQAAAAAEAERRERRERTVMEEQERRRREEDETRRQQERDEELLSARQVKLETLAEAEDEAYDEVGITLDRRDRENMKSVVFLIKDSVHKVMRQAAFDNRVTMQAILRSGLMMWLLAHGYALEMRSGSIVPPTDLAATKSPRDRRGQATRELSR